MLRMTWFRAMNNGTTNTRYTELVETADSAFIVAAALNNSVSRLLADETSLITATYK